MRNQHQNLDLDRDDAEYSQQKAGRHVVVPMQPGTNTKTRTRKEKRLQDSAIVFVGLFIFSAAYTGTLWIDWNLAARYRAFGQHAQSHSLSQSQSRWNSPAKNTSTNASTPTSITSTTTTNGVQPNQSRNQSESPISDTGSPTNESEVIPEVLQEGLLVWNERTVRRLQRHLDSAGIRTLQPQPQGQPYVPIRLTDSLKTNGTLELATGRLVVHVNDQILLPTLYGQGQRKLVQLLASMTLKTTLDHLYFPLNNTNDYEITIHTNHSIIRNDIGQFILNHPPLLNLTMDCQWQHDNTGAGQGNLMIVIYLMRMAAALAQVDMQLQCIDMDTATGLHEKPIQWRLLTPWMVGYQPSLPPLQLIQWPFDRSRQPPSHQQVTIPTGAWKDMPVYKMTNAVLADIRRMAVMVVEASSPSASILNSASLHDYDAIKLDRTMAVLRQQYQTIPSSTNRLSLGPATTATTTWLYDDVAIHFRCGDIMGKGRRNDYGFIKFSEYTKWIHNHTESQTNNTTPRSIGIITQPFDKNLLRPQDHGREDQCRNVTHTMVAYLQHAYPNARVSIHNSANESLAHALTRLTLANQSFVSYSSFGIFPIIASYGDGYFQKGHPNVNFWANNLPKDYPHLHMMTSPKLTTGDVKAMNFSDVLKWFVTDK